ncbi:MAG: winged helix-turn-helix domain-containing protein [Candidatus Marsarchaeota archaeon]|nr:winged helix-turn-helix domain-containing protein [Candidatus Marsarchaeota archaeon]
MSKTFGTKKRIVKLLSEKTMDITEISAVLGLSKATVSQHISELENMSMVEQIDNSHFKRVKYYRLSGKGSGMQAQNRNGASLGKLIIPAIIAIILVGVLLFSVNQQKHTVIPNALVNTSNIHNTSTLGIGAACPMIIAFPNGSHANESTLNGIVKGIALGDVCDMAYVNPNGRIAGLNYTADNGTVYVPELRYSYTLNQTNIKNLETNLDNGYCSDQKALEFFGINYTKPSGVKCKANIYA